MSIEILTKNKSVKYLGQRISFHQQETLEIKSRIRAAWATFHKYRQELTSKKILAQLSIAPFRRHSFSDSLLRSRNMDTEQRTRRNDSIDATQDATTHHPDENKIQKKFEPKEEKGIVDITENCSTDDESDDGQSTMSKDDVDSEVTFDEDSEKEIDTIEIEEEEWIEYIKRSTADALDKMERAKIRCWNRTHKK